MKSPATFRQIVRAITDRWIIETSMIATPEALLAPFREALRPNMIVAAIDTRPKNIQEFGIAFIHCYRLPTGFADMMDILQQPRRFAEFPDQAYLRDVLIPACSDVMERRRPLTGSVTTRVLDVLISYDRAIFPQRVTSTHSSWCLALLDVKFLLPATSKAGNTNDLDLGILQLLAEGTSTREIAAMVNMSPRTIEHRLERLKSSFGARNLAHLVALTVSRGIRSHW